MGLTSLKNRKFSMTAVCVENEANKAGMTRLCRASNLLLVTL